MNIDNPPPDPGEQDNGHLVPESTGQLNLRPEVLEGFLSVRQQVEQLNALLVQVLRKVALPRSREIGAELARVRDFYPKGQRGPGGVKSAFYADAERVTGLKKRSVQNYIAINENWARLMDYMAELPEGATPVTSLRGALEAIREMNKPLQPSAAESIETTATEVLDPAAAAIRTNYAATTREKILPALSSLKAATVLSPAHKERLLAIETELTALLEEIDAAEADAAAAEVVVEAPLAPMHTPAVAKPIEAQWEEEPQQDTHAEAPLPDLFALFPATAEGLADLEHNIANSGSGAELARKLGNTAKKPGSWISKHRQKLKAKLAG